MKEKIQDKIKFAYYDLEEKLALESVWASKEGDFYRIENIPFFAPNIAYGDLVKVEEDEGKLFFDDIVEESGNSTLQIIIFNKEDIKGITKKIENFKCGWEDSHLKGYISVNIPKEVKYTPIKSFLDIESENGKMDYKEACLEHEY